MEFEYTASIRIYPQDLRKMYKRVKNGENFSDVFYDIMAGYDDCDYYACDNIEDQVHEEIQRRLNQSLT